MMPSATHDETGCSNFPHCKSARMMSNPTERLPFLPVARGTFWGSVITTVMGMPLGRYFAVIGSVLLALLFLADRYLPQPAATPHRAHVDRTVIRLQSDHRWPERIVIDTSLPTIVPPPARVADTLPARSPPVARPPTEAFALVTPAQAAAPAIARKPVPKRRTRMVRAGGHDTSFEATEFRTAFPMNW
jgi:hypothetical protein